MGAETPMVPGIIEGVLCHFKNYPKGRRIVPILWFKDKDKKIESADLGIDNLEGRPFAHLKVS
jgi:hypothetical protein